MDVITITSLNILFYFGISFVQKTPGSPMVYIFFSVFALQECFLMLMPSQQKLILTAKLLKQGYRYHKIRKAFSKFYHRRSELIVKYNIGLNTLLQQGISEPIFYGDLVYKFKRIVGKSNFSDQFKKIIKRYLTWMSCDSLHA